MRESYSYFQTPFRNAQVNRDSRVFGDLESRASAAAPTLFSLGGDPLPSQKFSRKYLTRHKKSGQLWRRAVRNTPGGVESNVRYFRPHPFLADYGDGGYIYDVDGNKILDLMMGFGALLLGHNNRDIALEVIKQLESGSMLGVTSELYIDYIQAVRKAVPSMKKVRLCNSGTGRRCTRFEPRGRTRAATRSPKPKGPTTEPTTTYCRASTWT